MGITETVDVNGFPHQQSSFSGAWPRPLRERSVAWNGGEAGGTQSTESDGDRATAGKGGDIGQGGPQGHAGGFALNRELGGVCRLQTQPHPGSRQPDKSLSGVYDLVRFVVQIRKSSDS